MITRRLLAFSAVALLTLAAWSPLTTAQGGGPISLTALDTPYAQDFDTLALAGTSSVVPTGWLFSESGTNANATYTAGTGSGNAGDTYSFGAAGSPERAFGGLQSGSLVPTVGALFTNNTGETITSLEIAYTGEHWRLGTADRVDQINFEYSLDATSLTTGVWSAAPALAFLSPTTAGPAGARDGNLPGNQAPVAAAITGLAIPPGNTFAIRWIDANATGADDGLAVDDFTLIPHGGGAATVSIADVSVTEGNTGTMTATFSVSVSTTAHDGVTFSIATAGSGGTAPATAGDDYVARAETGVSIPAGEIAYAFAVTINGDTGVEPDETFAVQLSDINGALSGDATAVGTIVNDDEPPPVLTDVVISQVYGAGGNSGATLTHDFVELFNPGAAPVTLDGWSVQYTSAAGTGTWLVTPLVGTIQPGAYFLVQMAAGTGGTQPLPTPDASGTIGMAAGAGKVALQTNATAIVGGCPIQATADLVGYGAASCFEGTAPTGQLSVSTAAIRKRGGCVDSDQNGVDFSVAPPTPRNSAAPARSCVAVPAQIHDIQGPGAVSPLAGQDVITTGIVTAIKANGFFLQAADDAVDADAATSEGLFAFTSATPAVAVGNVVSARGTVSEFFGLTQIESSLPGDVTVTTSATVPPPIALTPSHLDPAGPPDQLERFEGMRLLGRVPHLGRADGRLRRDPRRAGGRRPAGSRARHPDRRSRPAGSHYRRGRLLHPALRRQPGTHRHRQRRARRLDGVDRDLERRHRRRHRPAGFLVRRLQAAAGDGADRGRQHDRPRRTRGRGGRVHRRRLQHRELRRQRCDSADQGVAGDPRADAAAGRHRPHRDPRSRVVADARVAGQRRCGVGGPAGSGLPGNADPGAARRNAERRVPGEDIAGPHRPGLAGARRRDLHQPGQRPERDPARSAAARPLRHRRSGRSEPAPGDRRRQPPALVHRHRARRRRRRARARQAQGAGGVRGRAAAGAADRQRRHRR